MIAVISAGGKGTRVASVRQDIPKPMLPIVGKPVLQHQIERLREQGIKEFIITIGHLGKQIETFFGDGKQFDVSIEYIEEKMPLGTAGALYYLKNRVHDDFLYLNGDIIFNVDLKRFILFHRGKHADISLLVHPNDHPYDSGVVVPDVQGRVVDWLTKEEKRGWYRNCVNAGIHIISPNVLKKFDMPTRLDLDRDVLRPMIPSGCVYAYNSPEYVKDMGTPDRIAQVEQDIQNGIVSKRSLACKQKAIFLDRDGTINRYVGFLRNIDDFELLGGAAEGIRKINRSDYLAIVVTNQPVIARGEVTWEELEEIHRKMETLLGREGAYVNDIFVCPHHPDRGFPGERAEYKIDCDCRKPKPGLLMKAAEKYNIDLMASWIIGDEERDMEAGRTAGCRTIKLDQDLSLYDAVSQIC